MYREQIIHPESDPRSSLLDTLIFITIIQGWGGLAAATKISSPQKQSPLHGVTFRCITTLRKIYTAVPYVCLSHLLGKTFSSFAQSVRYFYNSRKPAVSCTKNKLNRTNVSVMYAARKSDRQLFASPWTGTYEKYDAFRILDGINFEMDTHISKRVRTHRRRAI